MIIEIHLKYSLTISHQVRQQRYTCTFKLQSNICEIY